MLQKETFQSYCRRTGVTSINKEVNTNANKYPFITILRGNVSENIYFGRKSAAKIELGDAVKSIAKSLFVTEAVNASGQIRTKLSFSGESTYSDVDDMFD